jgi:putative SOS response-associated peptidase YedK
MCGRFRLTRRRLMEIEGYYGIDDLKDLDIWERQFNIPPREMAPIILLGRKYPNADRAWDGDTFFLQLASRWILVPSKSGGITWTNPLPSEL